MSVTIAHANPDVRAASFPQERERESHLEGETWWQLKAEGKKKRRPGYMEQQSGKTGAPVLVIVRQKNKHEERANQG